VKKILIEGENNEEKGKFALATVFKRPIIGRKLVRYRYCRQDY